MKQDCIPVWCVPPAFWPYPSMHCTGELGWGLHAWGGGVPAEGVGVPAQGVYLPGWYLPGEVYLLGVVPSGGMYLPDGVYLPRGMYLPRGLYLQEGCTCPGDVHARGCTCQGWGVYPSVQWGMHPLVNRMTDRCKNITLPQTSFAGGNHQLDRPQDVLHR